jgi:hypothetical protein
MSLRGASNVPRPFAVNAATPVNTAFGYCRNAIWSAGIWSPFAVNEYVESQPTNAAPATVPLPFAIVMLSRRAPDPSKRRAAVAFENGSP